MKTSAEKAFEFVNSETQFHLGHLLTEQIHPKTETLSQTACKDTAKAIRQLLSVDDDIVDFFKAHDIDRNVQELSNIIFETLERKGRIFITGCGSTGRLAILLDSIWRKRLTEMQNQYPDDNAEFGFLINAVNSIMSGGDYALIKAVEGFEDYGEFGKKQILDKNLCQDDLVIAITEGGETSFVIGTVQAAIDKKSQAYFIYNNTNDVLKNIKRSNDIIQDNRVKKICLATGPMGISGSTRLQATTAEFIVIGTAFETAFQAYAAKHFPKLPRPASRQQRLSSSFDTILCHLRYPQNQDSIRRLLEFESETYKNNSLITYLAESLLVDIMSDTTERSPTFSLPSFKPLSQDHQPSSWAYVCSIEDNSEQAWQKMLCRDLNDINWNKTEFYDCIGGPKTTYKCIDKNAILDFDISLKSLSKRTQNSNDKVILFLTEKDCKNNFHIRLIAKLKKLQIKLSTLLVITLNCDLNTNMFKDVAVNIEIVPFEMEYQDSMFNFTEHIFFKLLINTVSTLSMCILERVVGNIMVWVTPTNKKLIDRATRYVSHITGENYQASCIAVFKVVDYLQDKIASGVEFMAPVLLAHTVLTEKITPSEAEKKLITNKKAEVKIINEVPSLFIDNKQVPPFAYMSYFGETEFYKQISESDIHIYCTPAYLAERGINSISGIGPFRKGIWLDDNLFDFTSLETDLVKIMAADSKANIIVRLHLDCPIWWEKKYPEACCQLSDGSTFRQSFSSSFWLESTNKAMKQVVNWLQHSKFSSNIVGIHIAAGCTEEWFYHQKRAFEDLNPERLEKFQQWLIQKYDNRKERLQQAWQDEYTTFDTADISKISNLQGTSPRNQKVIDSFQYHSEILIDAITYFCQSCRQLTKNKLLIGVFYGYSYYLAEPGKGHYALSKLLKKQCIDYISSPNDYIRQAGEDWAPMTAVNSIMEHGKLWLAENDTRTFKTQLLKERAPEVCPESQYEANVWVGPSTLEDSTALLKCNVGRMLCNAYGGWWFDMWGGWFNHPDFLMIFKTLQNSYQYPSTTIKTTQYKAEVCIIIDEELSFYDTSNGQLSQEIIRNRYNLGKTGAPYHIYLRNDLKQAINKNQYKFFWLLGQKSLSQIELELIEQLRDSQLSILQTDLMGSILHNNSQTHFPNKRHWEPDELRNIYHNAKVHTFIDNNDIFYAGFGWYCLHSKNRGRKQLTFPKDICLKELFTGEIYQSQSKIINLENKHGTTTYVFQEI